MSTIRKADEDDLDSINSVIRANRAKKDDLYKFPYLFSNSKDIIPTKAMILFVVTVHKNAIAFLSLHNYNLFESGSRPEFEIVVHPDHRDRKKHHGENLLRYVIEYARKETSITHLIGKVIKENTPSIRLLEKCGFTGDKSADNAKGYTLELEIDRQDSILVRSKGPIQR